MNRIIFLSAAFVMLIMGAVTPANALDFGVGPGGVYVGPGHPHYYDCNGDCRTVITHRINRFDEDVEVRQLVCDCLPIARTSQDRRLVSAGQCPRSCYAGYSD